MVIAYFGEGASNVGDFHEALNFAGVQQLPIVFICENNQYAISAPLSLQLPVPSVAERAAGYGMPAERCDGMSAQEVLDDMARLQLINGILNAPDPITRRKVLHHSEPYINDEIYVVIETLKEQMAADGNNDMVEKLGWVRGEIERYKKAQQARLKKQPVEKETVAPEEK